MNVNAVISAAIFIALLANSPKAAAWEADQRGLFGTTDRLGANAKPKATEHSAGGLEANGLAPGRKSSAEMVSSAAEIAGAPMAHGDADWRFEDVRIWCTHGITQSCRDGNSPADSAYIYGVRPGYGAAILENNEAPIGNVQVFGKLQQRFVAADNEDCRGSEIQTRWGGSEPVCTWFGIFHLSENSSIAIAGQDAIAWLHASRRL